MMTADEILDDLEREREGRIAGYEATYYSGHYPVREYPKGTFYVQMDGAWIGPLDSEEDVESTIEDHEAQ